MKSIEAIHPVMIVNQTGTDYIVKYKNAWIDGRSRCVSRKTVGKLDGNKVIFGRKFLAENPQYQGVSAIYEDNRIIFVDDEPEVTQFLELSKKYRMMDAGATYVLNEIAEKSGLAQDLRDVFPRYPDELLSLAMFMILQPQSSVCGFDAFAEKTFLPSDKQFEPSAITRLFQSITDDQRFEYMRRRAAHSKNLCDHGYWAFDTTSISTFSETIRKAKYGKNKEGDKLPQVNLALLLDEVSGEPIYYKTLNGSLNDSVLLRNLFVELVQLDLESINIVIDRGFFSMKNLSIMYRNDIGFVAGAKTNLSLVAAALHRAKPQLRLCIPRAYAREVNAYSYTEKSTWVESNRISGRDESALYTHVYYSKEKETAVIHAATAQIQKFEEELARTGREIDDRDFRRFFTNKHGRWETDDQAWIEFCETAGFFVLLSNRVSDPVKALQIYRNRDVIEKAFNNYKERCSGRRFQCEESALEGKVFVQYVALSLLMMLKKRLEDQKLPCDSTPKYLEELNAIRLCRIDGTSKNYWQELSKKERDMISMAGVELPRSIS